MGLMKAPAPPSFTLQWFAVEAALRPLASLSPETGEMSPGTGLALPAGARVTAHVRNTGAAPLYVTHWLVQADGEVTLLLGEERFAMRAAPYSLPPS